MMLMMMLLIGIIVVVVAVVILLIATDHAAASRSSWVGSVLLITRPLTWGLLIVDIHEIVYVPKSRSSLERCSVVHSISFCFFFFFFFLSSPF